MRLLLLLCPNCKHRMKYQWNQKPLENKSKRCVYCPKSFKIKPAVIRIE